MHKRILVAAICAIVVFVTIAGCATPNVELRIRPISLSIEPAPVPPVPDN